MMAKSVLASVATLLFALAIQTANAEYDVAKYCQLVPAGTKMPSYESCQTYYSCNAPGTQATSASCASTQSFDKDTQTCRPSSSVNCYYGVEDPCQNKNNVYVPIVNDCQGYIWCVNNAEKGRGSCPNGQLFDSASSSCIYGDCTGSDTGNGLDNVQNVCGIMQSGQYFGSFDDCNQWSICSNLQMQNGTCTTGLVFNTQSRMCLKNDGTMCDRTNGEEPILPDTTCNADNINQFSGDANVCSIGYKCDGKAWQKIQCVNQQYFDVPSGACLSRQAATPGKGCNRCQYSTSTWVNAVDYECQDYLTCKAGAEVGQGQCATDQFFNEQRQACVVGTEDLLTYREKNGACSTYNAPSTTIEPPTTESEDKTTEEGEKVTDEEGKTTEKEDAPTEADKTTEATTEDDKTK